MINGRFTETRVTTPFPSILELSQKIRSKELSCVQLTEQCLSVIDRKNTELNAFVSVNREGALEMAANADRMIADGEGNELTGLPVGVKDNFCELGVRSEACSNILKGYIPPYEGTVLAKLRQMGAVFIGHTNTDEFTMGASTETSSYGVTKNPVDPTRVAGGSSGGSAAAVAAGMCVWALGTDTGGSIRQPAAFCGVTGLKVTYGRVSRYGIMSMASSWDTIGALANSSHDAAVVLKYIAGSDTYDSTTPNVEVDDYPALLDQDIKGLKIGVPKEYFVEGLDSEVESAVRKSLADLEKQGAELVDISLPSTKYGLAVYYVLSPSEVSSNMARYDGIRFGPKSDAPDLVESYFDARTKGFGNEVKRRIMIGTYALSAGYYDAYYKKASKVRTLIRREFDRAFEAVDVIVTPVAPGPAFRIGENTDDPVKMYLEDVMTIPASAAGICGISVPCGKTKTGLPIGVQILGGQFDEATILRVGAKLGV
jgi:aspartyl-tRNA(Asn)/glutamyl-tRNA(Gln) amidotransferase subunit A